MSEAQAEPMDTRDKIAATMRSAGLHVEEERLDELSGLLEAATEAASHLDDAASRIPLSEALADLDPAWREGER